MSPVIHKSLCGTNIARKIVALTPEGIYELSALYYSEPHGNPTIPVLFIKTVRIDSATFELKGKTADGTMLSRVFSSLRTGLWAEAFSQIGIPCECVGNVGSSAPWDVFPYSLPVMLLPAAFFLILALISFVMSKIGGDLHSLMSSLYGWLVLLAALWCVGFFVSTFFMSGGTLKKTNDVDLHDKSQ